jgi:hypothetical protein
MTQLTLVEVAERLGGPIFGLEEPKPLKRQGSVGHGDGHLELYFIAGPTKAMVRVAVRLEQERKDFMIANLVSNDALSGPLRFPLNLSVTRGNVSIPVDGVPVTFTSYVSRRVAVAVAEIDGRWVYVNAPSRTLRRIAIRREKPAQLRRFLERMDRSLAEHRAAAEALRHSLVRPAEAEATRNPA